MASGWYLGPVGSLLEIVEPNLGSGAPLTRQGGTHQLLGGGRVRDRVGEPRRDFALSWQALSVDELAVIEGLYLGAYGPGPYVLIDPSRRNLLSPNQSSGTDVLRDVTGFAAAGSGSVSSSASSIGFRFQGARSLAWITGVLGGLGNGPVTGALTNGSAADDDDVPVVSGLAYTASVYARRGSAPDVPVSVALRLRWFASDGTLLSSNQGSTVALSFAMQRITVTATAPASAAYARLLLGNETTTAATTGVWADGWQLEQASTASAWVPGLGVPRVSFDDFGLTYPFLSLHDITATLVEV